jgi:hypothetical protein
MSEQTEGVAEVDVAQTSEPAVAIEEAPAETAAEAPSVEAEAEAEPEPEAEPDEPAAEVQTPVEEHKPEAVVADKPVAHVAPGRREAQLYLCERGHRTLILWGDPPTTCNARKTRNEVCGLTLYHSTELPDQVQKALNPIKASKKKSGKK